MEEIEEEEKRRGLDGCRDGVIWYLGRKLEKAGETQREMMERRLEREVERGRSQLYVVKEKGGLGEGRVNGYTGSVSGGEASFKGREGGIDIEREEEGRREIEQQLSPEQLQLFAQENQDMLKQYEDTLDQVR